MTRKGIFKELIYTRCGPAYSIRGDALPTNNGYAIFNSTEGLWKQLSDADLQYVQKLIVRQFQWNYGCPVKRSWSYLLIPNSEEGVFADLYAYTEEDGANNSANSNMRGSHLAQMFSGVMTMYPYELIESPYFGERQKASTDIFYLDDCAPRLPDRQQANVQAGPLTFAKAAEFMRGREKAVQACAAWIIEQMSRPVGKRRPIVILDDAKQIPRWIAAITTCFPVTLARQIGFYTCREGLTKPNTAAFYRADVNTGEYIAQTNLQDPNQESRPMALLLGCATEDADAARQIASLAPDASCVVLDGKKASVNFTPDAKLMSSCFITQCTGNPVDHAGKLRMLEEVEGLPFTEELLPLYEAVYNLTRVAHPTLKELTRDLKTLKPCMTVQHSCIARIMNMLIEQGDYSEVYARQDALNGCELLAEIIDYTGSIPKYAAEVEKLTLDCLHQAVEDASDGLPVIWGRVQENEALARKAVNQIIGAEQLKCLSAEKAHSMSEQNCAVIFQMQECYIKANPGCSWESVVKSREDKVMQELMRRSLESDSLRHTLFGFLRKERAAADLYILGGADYAGKTPRERLPWWIAILEEGYSVSSLMDTIEQSRYFEAEDLERVLVSSMKSQGLTPEIQRLYKKYLAGKQGCGEAFFSEALKQILSKDKPSSEQLEALLQISEQDSEAADRKKQVIHALDSKITLSADPKNEALAAFVAAHVSSKANTRAQLYRFIAKMTVKTGGGAMKLFHRQEEFVMSQWVKVNPEFKRMRVDSELTNTTMGGDLLTRMAENSWDIASALLITGAFTFTEPKAQKSWLNAYASILDREYFSAKDTSFGTICALKALLTAKQKPAVDKAVLSAVESIREQQAGDGTLERNVETLIRGCTEKLAQDKKAASYTERWIKACMEEYGESASKILKQQLDEAIESYNNNHPQSESILKRLFGRFGGK